MDNNQESEGLQIQVEEPDLDNIEPWLTKYVTKPFKGMDAKTHPDGRPYSPNEVLEATRDQFRYLVLDRTKLDNINNLRGSRGLDPYTQEQHEQYIKKTLTAAATGLNSNP